MTVLFGKNKKLNIVIIKIPKFSILNFNDLISLKNIVVVATKNIPIKNNLTYSAFIPIIPQNQKENIIEKSTDTKKSSALIFKTIKIFDFIYRRITITLHRYCEIFEYTET